MVIAYISWTNKNKDLKLSLMNRFSYYLSCEIKCHDLDLSRSRSKVTQNEEITFFLSVCGLNFTIFDGWRWLADGSRPSKDKSQAITIRHHDLEQGSSTENLQSKLISFKNAQKMTLEIRFHDLYNTFSVLLIHLRSSVMTLTLTCP